MSLAAVSCSTSGIRAQGLTMMLPKHYIHEYKHKWNPPRLWYKSIISKGLMMGGKKHISTPRRQGHSCTICSINASVFSEWWKLEVSLMLDPRVQSNKPSLPVDLPVLVQILQTLQHVSQHRGYAGFVQDTRLVFTSRDDMFDYVQHWAWKECQDEWLHEGVLYFTC